LGHPEGVTIGRITVERQDEPVEVVTLTISDDPTYIAGGLIVHNCMRCAALDGKEWDLDGKALGHKFEFTVAPLHWNCRCVLTGKADFSAIDEVFPGFGAKFEALLGTRATAQGPQKVTMAEWLKRNPAAATEILGKRRVDRFMAGEITLTDLVTKTGRQKTLDELAL